MELASCALLFPRSVVSEFFERELQRERKRESEGPRRKDRCALLSVDFVAQLPDVTWGIEWGAFGVFVFFFAPHFWTEFFAVSSLSGVSSSLRLRVDFI